MYFITSMRNSIFFSLPNLPTKRSKITSVGRPKLFLASGFGIFLNLSRSIPLGKISIGFWIPKFLRSLFIFVDGAIIRSE